MSICSSRVFSSLVLSFAIVAASSTAKTQVSYSSNHYNSTATPIGFSTLSPISTGYTPMVRIEQELGYGFQAGVEDKTRDLERFAEGAEGILKSKLIVEPFQKSASEVIGKPAGWLMTNVLDLGTGTTIADWFLGGIFTDGAAVLFWGVETGPGEDYRYPSTGIFSDPSATTSDE